LQSHAEDQKTLFILDFLFMSLFWIGGCSLTSNLFGIDWLAHVANCLKWNHPTWLFARTASYKFWEKIPVFYTRSVSKEKMRKSWPIDVLGPYNNNNDESIMKTECIYTAVMHPF
jgi:hypothetical protein